MYLPAGFAASIDTDQIEVSVLTFGPGPAVYERFGHIAIRIQVENQNIDYLYDWGNFDFGEPNFVGKFVKGNLLYSMAQKPTSEWLPYYQVEMDRSVTEQMLDLDPAQKTKLIELLDANLKNPDYLYDALKDNCSTRLRDVLDASVDNQLAPQWTRTTPNSYRWHIRRLMTVGLDNQALSLLLDICFGPRVDHSLSQWQAAFVPMELSTFLETAQLANADGSHRPLVKARRVLNQSMAPGNAEPTTAKSPVRWALPIGVILAAFAAIFSYYSRLGFWIIVAVWSAFAAFGAVFFVIILCLTRHWVVGWNENFLQFSPLSLGILAGTLVPRWRNALSSLPMLAVGLSTVGLAITISHLTIQQNAPAVCLAFPLHLAVMLGWKQRASSAADPIQND